MSSLTPLLQVLSGGVASNRYIRKALTIIAETTGLQLLCPPAKFCTDNGVMIAWCVFWRTANLIRLFAPFWESSNWNKTYVFLFRLGTVLNAWEKGKGYCLQMWMSAMSQSKSTLDCGLISLSLWLKSILAQVVSVVLQGTAGCWHDSRGEGSSHQVAGSQDEDPQLTDCRFCSEQKLFCHS